MRTAYIMGLACWALLAGCRPLVVVSYWEPARISVPNTVYQVSFVNLVESEDAEYLYRAVATSMKASKWFGVSDFAKTQTAFRHGSPASTRSVKPATAAKVCAAGASHAILALEQLVSNKVAISHAQMSGTGRQVSQAFLMSTNMTMQSWNRILRATAHWVLYDCDGNVINTFTVKGVSLGEIVYDSARQFVPEAGIAERNMYVSVSGKSRRAFNLYIAGKTEDAQAVWTTILNDASGQERAKILHNISVCFETRQLPEQALRTALKSREIWGTKYPMGTYIKHLRRRAVQHESFLEQMSGRKAARR